MIIIDLCVDPKYYNESCKNDTECFGGGDSPNSMVCKNDICTCSDNYVVEERFLGEAATQKICVTGIELVLKPCDVYCTKI